MVLTTPTFIVEPKNKVKIKIKDPASIKLGEKVLYGK